MGEGEFWCEEIIEAFFLFFIWEKWVELELFFVRVRGLYVRWNFIKNPLTSSGGAGACKYAPYIDR